MDSTVAVTKSRLSHAFDWTIVVLGSLIALAAVGWLVTSSEQVDLLAFLGVPLIVALGFFPMLVGRTGGGIEVGLDVCVLVFLLCVTEPVLTLVVWAIGTGVCQVLTDKQRATKAFNFGLGVLAGGLAIFVFELTRAASPNQAQELLAVGLGALVYFVFDFVVTSISLALEEGTPLRNEFAPRGAVTAGAAFLAISSLGYLAAIVYRQPPLWATGLLVVP